MNDDDSLVEEVSSSVLRRTDLPFGLGRKGLEGGMVSTQTSTRPTAIDPVINGCR